MPDSFVPGGQDHSSSLCLYILIKEDALLTFNKFHPVWVLYLWETAAYAIWSHGLLPTAASARFSKSALEWRRFHLQATGAATPGRATCLHYRLPQIAAIHKLHMPLHLEINSTTFRGPIEVSVTFLQKEHNSCKQCLHYHYLTPSPLPTTVPIIQQQCCPVTGRVLIALLHVSLRVWSYFMWKRFPLDFF